MPIGAAIGGAAVIGAGASVISSSKAAKAQKKAANQAAEIQTDSAQLAADTQLKMSRENNAFALDIYNRNEGHLSPFIDMGGAAGDQLMGLLIGEAPTGGSGSPNGWYNPPPATPTPTPSPAPSGQKPAPAPAPTPTPRPTPVAVAPTPVAPVPGSAGMTRVTGPRALMRGPEGVIPDMPISPVSTVAAMAAPTAIAVPNSVAALAPAPAAAPNAVAAAIPVAESTASGNYGASDVRDARRSGERAAVAAELGAGNKITPRDQRVGEKPTPGAYGSNYAQALYTWNHGGDPAKLAVGATAAPVGTGGAPAATGAPATGTGAAPATGSTPTPAQSAATAGADTDAWDTYKKSAEYQNRLNAGLDATATKYAAAGAFESGAEKKAINDYAQVFASNELATYMDNLYRQEALGAQAASSLAGVGTNFVSQVAANNQNAADAASQAALIGGQASGNAILAGGQSSANQWNAVGNAVGQVAGTVAGAVGTYGAPTVPRAPVYIPPDYGATYGHGY